MNPVFKNTLGLKVQNGEMPIKEALQISYEQGVKEILEAIKTSIEEKLKEPQYQHEGEDWQNGLIIAEEIIDDYILGINTNNKAYVINTEIGYYEGWNKKYGDMVNTGLKKYAWCYDKKEDADNKAQYLKRNFFDVVVVEEVESNYTGEWGEKLQNQWRRIQ